MDWFEKLKSNLCSYSLAEWYYPRLLKEKNGPIENINLFNDDGIFEAHVFLRSDLIPSNIYSPMLYSKCNGSGTDRNKATAIYKGISEALERWAFYTTSSLESEKKKYGFHLINNTSGMAAFPSFSSYNVRKIAQFEAIERFSLLSWWFDDLPSSPIQCSSKYSYIILQPIHDVAVTVILWYKTEKNKYVYGFATHKNLDDAKNKAEIELKRNSNIVEKYVNQPLSGLEARLLYFASEEGHLNFLNKVKSSQHIRSVLSPSILVDTEIIGPWTQYTRVWRFLYTPNPQWDERKRDEMYFSF